MLPLSLAVALVLLLAAPALATRLRQEGVDPIGGAPEEFAALIRSEITQWRDLAKSANIRLD